MDILDPAQVHAHDPKHPGMAAPEWYVHGRRGDDPYQHDYRQCSYCGSIHPEDMLALIRSGSRLTGTTKAYKRYLITPNPIAGQDCRIGNRSGPDGSEDIRGRAPADIQQKFYLDHVTPEQWGEIAGAARGPAGEPSRFETFTERCRALLNRDTSSSEFAISRQGLLTLLLDSERYSAAGRPHEWRCGLCGGRHPDCPRCGDKEAPAAPPATVAPLR